MAEAQTDTPQRPRGDKSFDLSWKLSGKPIKRLSVVSSSRIADLAFDLEAGVFAPCGVPPVEVDEDGPIEKYRLYLAAMELDYRGTVADLPDNAVVTIYRQADHHH